MASTRNVQAAVLLYLKDSTERLVVRSRQFDLDFDNSHFIFFRCFVLYQAKLKIFGFSSSVQMTAKDYCAR